MCIHLPHVESQQMPNHPPFDCPKVTTTSRLPGAIFLTWTITYVYRTEEGDAFEKEFNNSFSDATPILTNTKYTGNLFKRDDADYYKFTLQSSGSIMIQFSHELFDDGRNFWNITLLDDTTSNTIYSFASRGKPADTDSSTIQLPAGDYYVKISHDDFHSMDYSLLVEITE